MRVALTSPCFLGGKDPIGNDRVERNLRYVHYYAAIKELLGFDEMFLLDNASDFDDLKRFNVGTLGFPVNLFRFQERLVRGPGPHDYPYCWRALYALEELMNAGFDKIISIDSDGFILTKRLARFVKQSDDGWVSFSSENPRGNFPEASFHILNRNAFPLFKNFTRIDWRERVGSVMEITLPFTDLRQEFRVGRFGEHGAPMQDASMDAYLQAPLTVPLTFGKFREVLH